MISQELRDAYQAATGLSVDTFAPHAPHEWRVANIECIVQMHGRRQAADQSAAEQAIESDIDPAAAEPAIDPAAAEPSTKPATKKPRARK